MGSFVNITRDEYISMFKLQGELNDATNTTTWLKEAIGKYGNIIDWFLCMSQETSEAIDSIQWKHWKDTKVAAQYEYLNKDNVETELVDIWHFLMSQILVRDELLLAVNSLIHEDGKYVPLINGKEVLSALKDFQLAVLSERETEVLLHKFFRLVVSVFNDPRDLLKSYMKKNVLNQFRQDHGYTTGTYIKVWSGEEDNVYLDKYDGEYEYNAIYEYLNKNYKEFAIVDSNTSK